MLCANIGWNLPHEVVLEEKMKMWKILQTFGQSDGRQAIREAHLTE